MRKLTIGMCTYDDFDGVYFTIQSIRMYHSEVLDDIEFIIVDNNPLSKHGESLKHFTTSIQEPYQYIPFTDYTSTTIKNIVFEKANTPYVLCVDCHVLLEAGSIKKLIEFYDKNAARGLYHGPLLYDNLEDISTHFNLTWSSHMWGQWGTDSRGFDRDNEPFDIPAQGCGLFTCRKADWLGFNPNFRGFGGEEGYIHEKYRRNNREVKCLPFLGWCHRFGRPNGIPYTNTYNDWYRNYIIGALEIGLDTDAIEDAFLTVIPEDTREYIKDEVVQIFEKDEVVEIFNTPKTKCNCRS